MFNPRFDEFNRTVRQIVNTHYDYLADLTTECKELKDEDGDVYQIVMLIHIKFK